MESKLDLILEEMQTFSKKLENIEISNTEHHTKTLNSLAFLDEKVDNLDKKVNYLDEKVDNLDKKVSSLGQRVTDLESQNIIDHKEIFENINRLDRRITQLDSKNNEEHSKILEILSSLNSAFIRYESEELDKIRILFDSDVDRKDHQNIYAHEFTRLNDLVAKNSFRISNLEQNQKN